MSDGLRGGLLAVWELLVEDGRLAVGIVAALAMTWLSALLLPTDLRNLSGWFLLVLLTSLIVVNLRTAGRRARDRTR